MNLSLASCSPAELVSVSIHQAKNQLKKLYLQLVKKDSHLPVLVFMKFLEPYEQYKKQTEEKGKKALKESGYYLQRYNEFMR